MIRDDNHPYNTRGGGLLKWFQNDQWIDSIDIRYPETEGFTFWGTDGPYGRADDVFQGSIGNCWFMHGASAVAQVPNRIEKVFLNDSLSNTGIYGCQMYALGVPVTVTVDDVLPLDDDGHTVFAKVGSDQALWPLVLEKCFAKLHGNYEAIIGGDAADSIKTLIGSPSEYTRHTAGMKDGSAR